MPVGECAITTGAETQFRITDCDEEHPGLCQTQGIYLYVHP